MDYSKPAGDQLKLFARSVARRNTPIEPTKEEGKEGKEDKLPWLVYLQGGPGFGCGTPQSTSWVDFVLNKGYQVFEVSRFERDPCLHVHSITRCCFWINEVLGLARPSLRQHLPSRVMLSSKQSI